MFICFRRRCLSIFFFFQAHWPDWLRPDLSAEHHVRSYVPFLQAMRRQLPDVRTGVWTDTGSNVDMRRSLPWIRAAYCTALEEGFDQLGTYEYCISRFIYTDPPEVIEVAALPDGNQLEIVFSKRMERKSVTDLANYRLDDGSQPTDASFDGGNIVTLSFSSLGKSRIARLSVENARDDANTFWFNNRRSGREERFPGNTIKSGSSIEFGIPEPGLAAIQLSRN